MTLAKAIARLTYKPGWAFGVEGTLFFLVFNTHDATVKRPRKVTAEMIRRIPPRIVEQVRKGRTAGLYAFVAKAIREREEHEVQEWLKVDGRCMVEPHPELVHGR